MKSIFTFTDYRKYILEWKWYNKYSYGHIGYLMNSSDSYLVEVMNHKKGLGKNTVSKLVIVFRFDFDEEVYFRALVSYSDSKNKRDQWFFKKMMKMVKDSL